MTERRVLLTGATGLLGTWLRRTAPDGVGVVALVHRRPLPDGEAATPTATVRADLRDPEQVSAALAAAAPDVVVHAAYATDEASIVDATDHVARAAAAAGAHLVTISTDAVYGGDGTARGEDDPPDPIADYGRWKVRAEQASIAHRREAAIVRLPLVVSLDPPDAAVARIARDAADGVASSWFDDELRQPAMAAELAAAIWRIALLAPGDGAGTWHLPGPERLSRLEIARRAATALGLPPEAVTGGPTPEGLERPRDLHLRDDRARRTIGWSPTPIFG